MGSENWCQLQVRCFQHNPVSICTRPHCYRRCETSRSTINTQYFFQNSSCFTGSFFSFPQQNPLHLSTCMSSLLRCLHSIHYPSNPRHSFLPVPYCSESPQVPERSRCMPAFNACDPCQNVSLQLNVAQPFLKPLEDGSWMRWRTALEKLTV